MLNFFIEPLQELIFPSYCLECDQRLPCRELPVLCNDCLADISFLSSPACPCCGMPFLSGHDHFCGLCLKNTFAFDRARAAMQYKKPVTSLISALKFNGTLTGLATLAHLAVNSPGIKDLHEPDMILPVPLHIRRLRERQFNQALVIGKSCFPGYRSRIHTGVLVRHRATSPQTSLNGAARRKNLAGAFSLTNPETVRNKTILLIDDVLTTGSTVNECARVLRRAGARRIEVFTLARAI